MSGISDERFERLERQVRRLRGMVLVMAVGIGGVLLMGATGTPDELALRKLTIVDAEGRERIVAGTDSDGAASVQHYDREGKRRISAGTHPGRIALLSHHDHEGKVRIIAGTHPSGSAGVEHSDRDAPPPGSRRTARDADDAHAVA